MFKRIITQKLEIQWEKFIQLFMKELELNKHGKSQP